MNRETFALSQKELQRVAVISRCVKGELACARAAGLLCLSVRQIKRLKKRMREDGEAALAHASRGRPSHRRLPQAVRERIVQLARGTYAGFNDHHLCEKLVEHEGFSLSRETLRRLLRQHGLVSPRKRRAPTHRQRRVRSAQLAELVQLDGSPHDWLEGRGPLLTALGMQDDATGKILAAQFFPSETTFGYLCLLYQMVCRYGVPLALYGDHSGVFVRNDDYWSVEEQLAGKRQPTQFGRALQQLGISLHCCQQPASQRPRRTSLGCAARSPHQRTAPRPSSGSRLRQRRAAPIRHRLQPPLRPTALRKPTRMAPGSGKSRAYLLLRARTHRQQRQRRAVGGPPLPDPPTRTPLQLRGSQSADLPSSRWARLARRRSDPFATLSTSRVVTVLSCS